MQETLGRQPGRPSETGLNQWEGPSSQPTGLETHMGTHSTHGESSGQGCTIPGRKLQVTAHSPLVLSLAHLSFIPLHGY